MRFTLTYRGALKANGRPEHKHRIRQHLHHQLKALWGQLPLRDYQDLQRPPAPGKQLSLLEELGPFTFVPLVAERIALTAELEITMLRPGPPGSLVTQSGDIDNRLKTLLDSLRMPHTVGELPPSVSPGPDESPFYCLLEDDGLLTKVAVETDRLLEPGCDQSETLLVIQVTTRQLRVHCGTIGLA